MKEFILTEIDLHTAWHDSGYDCTHCGGRILKRVDQETGQPEQVCLQCEMCGCQWTLRGELLRVGSTMQCRRAQRNYEAELNPNKQRPLWLLLLVGGGIVLLLALVLFGGLAAIRFLIPIAIFVFVVTAVYQFGRERLWW